MASNADSADRTGQFQRFAIFMLIAAVPVMKAPILVLATLSIWRGWNSLLWPQIVPLDEAKQLLMPAIVGALVLLAVYIYTQRHFVSALAGSVKG